MDCTLIETNNIVNKELAIPIPALVGQEAWREERTTNINDAIKTLVAAINIERDKQNNGYTSICQQNLHLLYTATQQTDYSKIQIYTQKHLKLQIQDGKMMILSNLFCHLRESM